MKKILLLLIVLSTVLTLSAIAEVNMPSAPSYGTPYAKNTTSPSYKKTTTQNYFPKTNNTGVNSANNIGANNAKIASYAKQALKAAENFDNETLNIYINKMGEAGMESFTNPHVLQKQTPQCPPIKINVNGKQLSGSKCVKMSYRYMGIQHDVGYCK